MKRTSTIHTTLTLIAPPLIAVVFLFPGSRTPQAQTLESGPSPSVRTAFIDEDGDGINDIPADTAGETVEPEKKPSTNDTGKKAGVRTAGKERKRAVEGAAVRTAIEKFDESVNCMLMNRFRHDDTEGMFDFCNPHESFTRVMRGARRMAKNGNGI